MRCKQNLSKIFGTETKIADVIDKKVLEFFLGQV